VAVSVRTFAATGFLAASNQGGLLVEHCPPIASPADLQDAGNAAAENGKGDFRVVP
jgi:hypothetical protein